MGIRNLESNQLEINQFIQSALLFPHIFGKTVPYGFSEFNSLGTPPANNECQNAIDASGGAVSGTTDCATSDSNFCSPSMDHVVYYIYTVAGSGYATVNIDVTPDNATDVAVEVWTDCAGTDYDDTIDCGVNFVLNCVAAGTVLTIPVGSASGAEGTFDLNITETAIISANNSCDDAMEISILNSCESVSVSATTQGACPEAFSSGCTQDEDPTVWFTFTTGLETSAIDFTNVVGELQIMTDCPATTTLGSCISYDYHSVAEPSTQYWITGTVNGGAGDVSFDIALFEAPVNDDCGIAFAISSGTTSGTTSCASSDGNFCGASADHVVYYTYIVAGPGDVTINIDIIAVDAIDLAIEAWTDCAGTDYTSNLDCGSSLTLNNVPAGTTLTIPVGSASGGDGTFDLSVIESPGNAPANNTCDGAEEIIFSVPCVPMTVSGTTVDASHETFNADCTQDVDPTVWFTFTTLAGTTSVNITNVVGELQIITDCPASSTLGGCITGDETIILDPSTQYWISGTVNGGEGDISFDIALLEAPVNDDCGSAFAISSGTTSGTTSCASADGNFCGASADHVVYYTYIVAGPGDVTINIDIIAVDATDIAIEAWTNCIGTDYLSNLDCGSSLTLNHVPSGTELIIPVGSSEGAEGTFDLTITETPGNTPVNNTCDSAEFITLNDPCEPETVSGTTVDAGPETFNGACTQDVDPTVWFTFTTLAGTTSVNITNVVGELQIITDCPASSTLGGCITGDETIILDPSTQYWISGTVNGGEGDISFDIALLETQANDLCIDASNISGGITLSTTECATSDSNLCNASSDHVVYFSYIVDGPGQSNLEVEVIALTALDLAIEAWNDCAGTDYDSNIDCGTSFILNGVQEGTELIIPVGSSDGNAGTFELIINETTIPQAAYDSCEDALYIPIDNVCEPVSITSTTIGALPENFSGACSQNIDPTIWFSITTLPGIVSIEITNVTGEFQFFEECSTTNSISGCISGDISLSASGSTSYWISGTLAGGEGDIEFDITLLDAPENDDCALATDASNGVQIGTTACASADANFCNNFADHVVYYTYTVAGPGVVNVNIDVDEFTATDIAVEAWSDCNGTAYQSNTTCDNNIFLNAVPAGTTLTIAVGSPSEALGTFELEITEIFTTTNEINLVTNGQAECVSSLESYTGDSSCPQSSTEWFKINTDSDAAILMFEINGNAFTPVVEIRQGTCDGEIVEYEQGDNLDFYANIVASESYFIGVSSSLGNISDFFICASAFLQLVDCTNQVELERFRPSNPDENPDGPYCPGETVNFCYSVDFTIGDAGDPDGNNCQWIQGIVPVLGCGWDLETIDIADQAPPGWFWLDENEVDYNVENPSLSLSNTCCGTVGLEYLGGSLSPGDELPGGFWFTSPGGTGCTNDGDPDNMWGLPGGCGSTQSVEFCFDLRAKILQGVDCADDCIKDLSVHMFTFADGETGCWSNASCAGDVPIIFDAFSRCDEDSCGQDIDGDGFSSLLDCNDNDPSINPNAEELCDGIDNNCNGLIDEDACNLNTCTGDIIFEGGAGSFQNTDSLATQEFSFGFPDCKLICISLDVSTNGEAWIGPGNLETPDECSFGAGVGCEGDPFNSTAGDCDMCWDFIMAQIFIGDSLVYQNILGDDPEDELEVTWNTQINGADFPDTILGTVLISGQTFANAENLSFSNLMVTCLEYFDEDGDGFNSIFDCDDNNADIYPGAIEICDSIDNNCDGQIDEGATTFYYEDLDGDGYGNPMTQVESCDPVAGYSLNNTDCDDTNANINEGAIEIPNNGTDENCDGMDEVQGDDNDNDGYFGNDCNDTDPTINPGAIEICDGIDNNCDGQIDEGFSAINYYQDNDGDGYGNPEVSLQSCSPVAGYTLNNTDCDDSNEAINEAAVEIPDNGIDEDCDGSDLITDIDIDKDGFFNDVDCDDTNPLINPAADEICDGLDNNCDGEIDEGFEFVIFYSDADMDGYGTGEGFTDCIQPPDTSTEGGDCDDTNPDINPGATEIPNNNEDEDCDGVALIIDNDGDGWNSDFDCDDTNAAINPSALDLDVNGIDEDCDGVDGPSATQNIGDHTFTFYPNPTNDLIYIQTEEANKLKYELFDIKGKLKANGKVDQEINLGNFNTGVYLMKIIDIDSGEHSFVRIIKI